MFFKMLMFEDMTDEENGGRVDETDIADDEPEGAGVSRPMIPFDSKSVLAGSFPLFILNRISAAGLELSTTQLIINSSFSRMVRVFSDCSKFVG